MPLPDYELRREAAEAYGWVLVGWPANPRDYNDKVLLARWEDEHGNIVPEPQTRECTPPKPGVREYILENYQPHEEFLNMPYHCNIHEWRQLLFDDLTKRVARRQDAVLELPHTNSL
jgi:hypothetical protein